jgi:hypothetical protein
MNKYFCDRCGKETDIKSLIVFAKNDDSINLFCQECSSLSGTCHFCEHSKSCAFEQDPDPTPQFVVIQQRQQTSTGYSIIQRQVPNTARLRKFCFDGKCVCCNEDDPKDPFCCRHTGYATCGNFKEAYFESRNK